MRYALSSRFQGGFLGAAMGEILAAHGAIRSPHAKTQPELEGFQPAAEASAPSWGKVAIDQMRQLTNDPLALPEPILKPALSSAGLAIALLPLAFFYHEDIDLFHRQAQQRLVQWQLPSEVGLGAIVVGSAISLILREQLQPLDLIPQLLAAMSAPKYAAWADSLTQVQRWLVEESIASQFSTHRLSFAAALPGALPPVSLETIPIALAFYTFLSTPEDFRLSLLRVAQFPYQNIHTRSLACGLTAALSGTHNGKGGLPQEWRKALRNVLEKRSPLSLLWDVNSENELLEYVDSFMSAWSGMHNPIMHSSMRQNLHSRIPITVAVPRTIRPE